MLAVVYWKLKINYVAVTYLRKRKRCYSLFIVSSVAK